MLKILYLCADLGIPILGRKGASVHVRSLTEAFRRAGHSVMVASPLLQKSPWEKPARLKVPVLHVRPGAETNFAVQGLKAFNEALGLENSLPGEFRRILLNKDLVRQLRRRFENSPPDFIYERASLYATAGIQLAGELHRPLLLELNAPLAVEQAAYRGTGLGELAANAERWTLSNADAVLAVSAPLRDYVVSLGVEASRVHVVPNGVDPELFRPASRDPQIRTHWGLDDSLVLGFIGGLRPWHGVELLPALLERLRQRHPTARLVFVGDGPLRSTLECDLRERGLLDCALFTGAISHEEVPGLARHFDIALAPYPEADHAFYFSPLKLFEYMACGVPVVAAGLGQIAEVVRDGETGLLYRPGDLDGLTSACDRLLADPTLRARIGSLAAEEIRRFYTWDQNASRVVELAQTMLRERNG